MTSSTGPAGTSVPAPPLRSGGALAPFSHRVFLWVWLSAAVSNVGTFAQNVGAAWQMTELSRSAVLVAALTTATALPSLLLALPAGALADVVDRRRLLVGTQGALAAVSAVLAAVTAAGDLTPVLLLVFTALTGAGAALMLPAFASLTPDLVPRPLLGQAVALNAVSLNVAQAAGPALAGAMVAASGPASVFALNAVSFLGVLLVIARRHPERAPSPLPAEHLGAAMRSSLRYVVHARGLQRVLLRTVVYFPAAAALPALLPVVARERLGLPAGAFGLLFAAQGAGAVAAAVVLPRFAGRLGPDRMLLAGTAITVPAQAGVALSGSAAVVAVCMTAAGAGGLMAVSTLNTAVQTVLPGWVRGRGLAVYFLTFQSSLALGSLLWGAVAQAASPRAALLAAAGLLALAGAAAAPVRLAGIADRDVSAHTWPAPDTAADVAPEAGPVRVELAYRVAPADREAFAAAMRPVRRIRLRDGAGGWELGADAADPWRILESYTCPTWADYLNQRTRTLAADLPELRAALAFHDGGLPEVRRVVGLGGAASNRMAL